MNLVLYSILLDSRKDEIRAEMLCRCNQTGLQVRCGLTVNAVFMVGVSLRAPICHRPPLPYS